MNAKPKQTSEDYGLLPPPSTDRSASATTPVAKAIVGVLPVSEGYRIDGALVDTPDGRTRISRDVLGIVVYSDGSVGTVSVEPGEAPVIDAPGTRWNGL